MFKPSVRVWLAAREGHFLLFGGLLGAALFVSFVKPFMNVCCISPTIQLYTTVQAEIGATKLSQALQGHTHSRWMASSMCSHMHRGRLPSVYSLRVVNHSTGQANQRQRRSFLLPHVPSPDWMTPSFEN